MSDTHPLDTTAPPTETKMNLTEHQTEALLRTHSPIGHLDKHPTLRCAVVLRIDNALYALFMGRLTRLPDDTKVVSF
jgi:hypothetical protein